MTDKFPLQRQDTPESAVVHVVAAAIINSKGEVLLARRPPHAHQGGLWEFPGGKIENGEDVQQALVRELHEELGIDVDNCRPLIRVHHRYPDKSVLLDIWRVNRFHGEAQGREGQPVRWVRTQELDQYNFPAANIPIVQAVKLPPFYAITPEPVDIPPFVDRVAQLVDAGIRLIQLRAKSLDGEAYSGLVCRLIEICHQGGCDLLLNTDPATAFALDAAGVHLSSERLMALDQRPLPLEKLVGASCHNADELLHASAIGVDFVVVSPVLPTASHPGEPALGWVRLRELTELATVPVYALGGMRPEFLPTCYENGAQGMAAIGAIWNSASIADLVRRYQAG